MALLGLVGWAVAQEPGPADELRQLLRQGKYADAEAAARERLAELEAQGEDGGAAAVRDVLVESLWRGGKARDPETRALAVAALDLQRTRLGPRHPDVAECLNNLAVIEYFRGEYAEARGSWEEALAIREEVLGPRNADVAQLRNNLGNLFVQTGDFRRALPMYEAALQIRLEALGSEHPLVAQSLGNLAVLRTEMGDYAEALPLAEQALAMYRKLLPAGHPKIATSMQALARVLLETGETERAIALLEQVEQIWENTLGPEHPSFAKALNNRADELRKLGRLDEAWPLYQRAVAILEKALGPDHEEVAGALAGMGALEEARGNLPQAIAIQMRVLAIKEKAMAPDHPRVALTLTELGRLRTEAGDVDEALPLLRRAVDARRSSLGPGHPDVAASLTELATALAIQGDTAEALAAALDAEEIAREHLRLTGRSLSEQHALRYGALHTGGLDLTLTLAAEKSLSPAQRRQVLDALVRSRAVVLDGIAARQRSAALTDDPEVARLATELAAARSHLANLTVRGIGDLSPEAYRELLDEARTDRDRAERALAGASAAFSAELERGRLGLDDVVANLQPGRALVAYALARDPRNPDRDAHTYVAFVMRAGEDSPSVVPLGPEAEMEAAVAAWKVEAATGILMPGRDDAEVEAAYRRVGEALRARLWDPVSTQLEGIGRVYIVPDAAVNLVSLAGLPAPERGYLIEAPPLVVYLSAERDLVPVSDGTPRGHGLLALGAPDYDGTPEVVGSSGGIRTRATRAACGGFGSLAFDPLPGTAEEVKIVGDLWRVTTTGDDPVQVLTGAAASESAFLQLAQGRRILHLATHGFFLGEDCIAAAASSRGVGGIAAPAKPEPVDKPAPEPAPAPPAIAVGSPLLRAGLALAGANVRTKAGDGADGILTAEEIASMNLSGVDLAVLSACDTGVGEVRAGEGVFGLRRAMQVAGVRTQVLSLWSVDDESTRQWMEAFYSALLGGGMDTAEAARAAGRKVLDARRNAGESAHPFYWAAFVAAGI